MTIRTNHKEAERLEREICDIVQSIDEWSSDSPECAGFLELAIATLEESRVSIKVAGRCVETIEDFDVGQTVRVLTRLSKVVQFRAEPDGSASYQVSTPEAGGSILITWHPATELEAVDP